MYVQLQQRQHQLHRFSIQKEMPAAGTTQRQPTGNRVTMEHRKERGWCGERGKGHVGCRNKKKEGEFFDRPSVTESAPTTGKTTIFLVPVAPHFLNRHHGRPLPPLLGIHSLVPERSVVLVMASRRWDTGGVCPKVPGRSKIVSSTSLGFRVRGLRACASKNICASAST